MMADTGFVDIRVGPPVDTFGGAGGEESARSFEVFGYAFIGRKPAQKRPCSRGIETRLRV